MAKHKNNNDKSIHLKPKNPNQKDYIRSIAENDFTICNGPAGTGKSFVAIGIACQYLLEGKVDKILLTRPIIGCDNEIGALPGGLKDKIDAYMIPYQDYFKDFLHKDSYERFLRNNQIIFYPVELLRGHTYNNTFMILEEAQNATKKQIKLFLSRIGYKSKIVVMGDVDQRDIQHSGLEFCIDKLSDLDEVSLIEFGYSDICRHPKLAKILEVFDRNG